MVDMEFFTDQIRKLERNLGGSYSDEQLGVMFDKLEQKTPKQLEEAVNLLIVSEKYVPKLPQILAAIHAPDKIIESERVEYRPNKSTFYSSYSSCELCHGTGVVTVYRRQRKVVEQSYAFVCNCGLGGKIKSSLPQWKDSLKSEYTRQDPFNLEPVSVNVNDPTLQKIVDRTHG